jgi:hypothetical protein
MSEQTQKPKQKFVKWKEPPEGYKRKYKGDTYLAKLSNELKGSEFLENFIVDLCRKDAKWVMSEKQEMWLKKVEYTFLDILDKPAAKLSADPNFDDGLGKMPSLDEIPF